MSLSSEPSPDELPHPIPPLTPEAPGQPPTLPHERVLCVTTAELHNHLLAVRKESGNLKADPRNRTICGVLFQRFLAEHQINFDDVSVEKSLDGFASKVFRIDARLRTAKQIGGSPAQKVLEKMKSEKTEISIFFNESLQLRQFLWSEQHKVEAENEVLSKENDSLRATVQGLKNGLLGRKSRGFARDHSKVYSRSQMYKNGQGFCKDVTNLVKLAEKPGYSVSSFEMTTPTGAKKRIVLNEDAACTSEAVKVADVDAVLQIKDQFLISNEAYHRLASVVPQLPRCSTLRKRARDLNAECDVHVFKGAEGIAVGAYQKLSDVLPIALGQLDSAVCGSRITVKISGDGTKNGKFHHVFNFAFSLRPTDLTSIDLDPSVYQDNLRLLATVELPESYDTIARIAETVVGDPPHTVNTEDGRAFEIKYILSGDLKFLAISAGISAANSEFACVWCKVPKRLRHDMTLSWSMSCEEGMPRTVREITALATKKSGQRFGVKAPPIFPFVPVENIVPDILHLLLRVSDILFDRMVSTLRKIVNIDRDTGTNASVLQQFVDDVHGLGVPLKLHIEQSGDHSLSTLSGNHRLKILRGIDPMRYLPPAEKPMLVSELWVTLADLYVELSHPQEPLGLLSEKCKKWVNVFTSVYLNKEVTPYMHILGYHAVEAIQRHGPMYLYSQQRLEYMNHRMTQSFFRGTNHKAGGQAHVQTLHRANRSSTLDVVVSRTPKRAFRCSACGQVGHRQPECTTPRE